MKFIALVSGGKDSLFAILHAMRHGHEPVALAHLYPRGSPLDADGQRIESGQARGEEPGEADEDGSSYMYQTVGHSLVRHVAAALALPLFSRAIEGTPRVTGLNYPPRPPPHPSSATTGEGEGEGGGGRGAKGDETEDMAAVLLAARAAHPDAAAVSCGAILSTYQRTRVESVAARVGLAVLAPLWRYPYLPSSSAPSASHPDGRTDEDDGAEEGEEADATALLADMRSVRQRAILLRVAGAGLPPALLGEDVSAPRTVSRLRAAAARFGGGGWAASGAALGEGGEFETLAVAGPRPRWKGRVAWTAEGEVVDRGAGSFELVVRGARVEEYAPGEDVGDAADLRVPRLLDPEFLAVLRREKRSAAAERESSPAAAPRDAVDLSELFSAEPLLSRNGRRARLANITGPGPDAAVQTTAIGAAVHSYLREMGLRANDVVAATLSLRDMADYPAVNAAYAPLFQDALPPSRVAIACGELLPPGVRVVMSVDIYDHGSGKEEEKRGLHVQSRSYWAPANIGPYSQAICEALPAASSPRRDELDREEEEAPRESRLVHMAGQIPLLPMTMELAVVKDMAGLVHGTEEPQTQAARLSVALSLQHLWRVGQATDVRAWTGGLAFVATDSKDAVCIAQDALQQWKETHIRMQKRTGVRAVRDSVGGDSIPTLFSLDSEKAYIEGLAEIYRRRATITDPPSLGEDVRPPLPDHTCIISSLSGSTPALTIPPAFAVLVAELPRGAPVEWHSIGLVDSGIVQHGCAMDGMRLFHTASCSSATTTTWISIPHSTKMDRLDSLPGFKWVMDDKRPLVTLYAAGQPDVGWVRKWKAQVIPCYELLGEDGPLHGLVVVTWYPTG